MSSYRNAGFNQPHFSKKSGAGFTIIEILIVTAIIGILSAMLFFNFRSPQSNLTARNQTVAAVVSDIRRAQTMAINSSLSQGLIVCGYGIHYVSSLSKNNYLIYTKPKPVGGCSTVSTHNFLATDPVIQNIFLANPNMELAPTCSNGSNISFNGGDIFFEPPDPKTYLNNDATLSAKPMDVFVRVKSVAGCNAPTATINITTAGSINVQ